ncbi:hypothetical protein OG394_11625 [Kribbella sp. NBC_01245]|uniref:hypothetical protein n=1 Tax=Kribbella sp. NBC_01245 TaxID=2903578 RepID=UPI002E290F91|nr:hypothetical protein [Kribbella sp. NBC_01245]
MPRTARALAATALALAVLVTSTACNGDKDPNASPETPGGTFASQPTPSAQPDGLTLVIDNLKPGQCVSFAYTGPVVEVTNPRVVTCTSKDAKQKFARWVDGKDKAGEEACGHLGESAYLGTNEEKFLCLDHLYRAGECVKADVDGTRIIGVFLNLVVPCNKAAAGAGTSKVKVVKVVGKAKPKAKYCGKNAQYDLAHRAIALCVTTAV